MLVHRHGDSRYCTATTTVVGQSTVFVNGLLAAVDGDPETHGQGQLVSTSPGTVFVEGKKLIVVDDNALADSAPHSPPTTKPSTGSPNVKAY
jgi:uncharacterized Zn-binding protein involved in type VI secretion